MSPGGLFLKQQGQAQGQAGQWKHVQHCPWPVWWLAARYADPVHAQLQLDDLLVQQCVEQQQRLDCVWRESETGFDMDCHQELLLRVTGTECGKDSVRRHQTVRCLDLETDSNVQWRGPVVSLACEVRESQIT